MALRPPLFIRRVLALFRWRSRDRDMEREMAFHVDSLARDYARDGMSDVDARRAARQQFGNLTRLKERGHVPMKPPPGRPYVEDAIKDADGNKFDLSTSAVRARGGSVEMKDKERVKELAKA